jgi:hypothetical protein
MKKIFSISIISVLAFVLTGCAPALKADDLSVQMSLGEWQYSLVGDEAIIESTVKLKTENTSKYNLVLQVKDKTDKWADVEDQAELSGSLSTKFSLKLDSESDQILRVALMDNDGKLIASSEESTLTTKDLKLGIRDLYYDEVQACEGSDTACFNFGVANNYPGLYKVSAKQKKTLLSKYYWDAAGTPKLDTILPDTNWLLPVRKCDKAFLADLDVTKPLPGRTYTVEVGGSTVHVTYLKGNFYFYKSYC